MVVKILFVLLILCTAALVAVGIGVLLRVRRHLKAEEADRRVGQESDEASEPATPKDEPS